MLHGISEAEVIRKALDSLDWADQERQAIESGIVAWQSGDVQDFKSFEMGGVHVLHRIRFGWDAESIAG